MGQRGIMEGTTEWYLIASQGAMVVRVRPGMTLGETPSGELSFDPSWAQLELEIADDGELLLNTVDDSELESSAGTRCRSERLTRHRRAVIALPNNVLRLDTDFADPASADDTVELRAVRADDEPAEPALRPVEDRAPDLPQAPAEVTAPTASGISPVTEQPGAVDADPDGSGAGPARPSAVTPRPPRSSSRRSRHGHPGQRLEPTHGLPLPRREREVRAVTPPATPTSSSTAEWAAANPTREPTPASGVRPTATATPSEVPGYRPFERAGSHRQRTLTPLTAVLIGLAGIAFGIGFALLYPSLSGAPATQPATTAAGEPARTGIVERSAPADPGATLREPSGVPAEPFPPLDGAVPGPPAAERTGEDPGEALAARSTAAASESPATSGDASTVTAAPAPAIEPVVAPTVARRDLPEPGPAEPTADTRSLASADEPAPPAAGRTDEPPGGAVGDSEAPAVAIEPTVTPPDPTLVAELETIGAAARAQTLELSRRRDLIAADLAVTQGRLTRPAETSAFTLYSRILAQDPQSEAARDGLQAVRQALINRALAQLAGGDLDAARATLESAEQTGANPMLIADLRGEIDNRQQQLGAAGEVLFPVENLVPVSQEPPLVPSYSSSEPEVSIEVQFTVTAGGEVRDVAVLGDPPENLGLAVQRAVGEWRFEPVISNGRPTPVRSSVRFTFRN